MLEPLLLQRTKGEIMDEKATTKTEVAHMHVSHVQRRLASCTAGGGGGGGV
ncbi:hypothetical protein Esi_0282_0030 [Ectocarpus siliculosus]|uniref:Uncharacterized protein n=1 Tax=Ectocarpus siliculosus TaxID=2880 RepID=D7FUZ3_ECTSI|nr:hypothetical protein Esi_0282_0030 [Ectocarpus siliculosus]|eukprot:CBJ31799.1 hypothetical protein Esi_0282_0030 [Ectocarpus siliculosus]